MKIFILEESFGACHFINEYLEGKNGNLRELVLNFRQGIWRTQEMIELISWMKSYNETKSSNQQIKFYGNDCMFHYELSTIIKKNLKTNNLTLTQEEINLLDFFAKEFDFSTNDKSNSILSKRNELKKVLFKLKENKNIDDELKHSINAADYFTEFLSKPTQETRDFYMAKRVENIYDSSKKKIFLWAHNDHIKKTVVHKDRTPSMGNLLDEKFKNKYYAVGFEFGVGELYSYNLEEKKGTYILLDKPIKNTNSEFLFSTNNDISFIDFDTAIKNDSMKKFLSQKRDYIMIGGYGLLLKYLKYNYVSEKYIDMYNGLIYIKKISQNSPIQ